MNTYHHTCPKMLELSKILDSDWCWWERQELGRALLETRSSAEKYSSQR
uniref:Uncharacterized protein n=1 Tax=Anguilla anguilla TaxID=7936 RepID=A0A0E9RBS3_ANGAN